MKFKVDEEDVADFIHGSASAIFLYLISFMLFLGLGVYRDLGMATTFESWVFLMLFFLGGGIFVYGLSCWRFVSFSRVAMVVLFVAFFGESPPLYQIALYIIMASIIYGFLELIGLEIKPNTKIYWRGGKVK